MESTEIKKSQVFKLASLADLIRLVVSHMNLTKQGFVYFVKFKGKFVFFMTHLIPGWYDLRGLPVTLLAYTDEEPPHNFIAYKFGDEMAAESWEFVEHIKTSPKIAHIPIIRIQELPDYLTLE